MKLLLKIKYDGTAYAGYQVQKNAPTVQEKLNDAVESLFGCKCDITGCSRTDSGVHALCFCATVEKHGCDYLETSIPLEKIPFALNVRLPDDIAVCDAVYVPSDFHARYAVVSKAYEYRILNTPHRDPFANSRAYHYPKPIDDVRLADMQSAADRICGKHDFASFMASGSDIKDTVRNVFFCSVSRDNDMIVIRIGADGFLYNMVRIICGTLIEVAKGSIAPDEIDSVISSCDRRRAGPTLPPQGLYLADVKYEKNYFA